MTQNEAEFRRLVEQHQSMVFSIAFRIAGERGAAEEVAQDVFVELHRALAKMESEDHIRFWLRRVTVNRATDYLRRRAARPEWKADEFEEELLNSFSRESQRSLQQIEVRLEQMVSSLPGALRGAVVLRYQEDLDPDEIATVLGQPVTTVKSNLQRALGLLRRKASVMLKEYVRE